MAARDGRLPDRGRGPPRSEEARLSRQGEGRPEDFGNVSAESLKTSKPKKQTRSRPTAAQIRATRNLLAPRWSRWNAAEVYPIVIAEWRRNDREIIRISLDRFNNRETIDIRSWWQDSEGNWRPGRGGLTLAIKHLAALAEGLADALDRARALGLIEPVGNTNTSKDRTAAERQRRYRQRHNGHDRNAARDVTEA